MLTAKIKRVIDGDSVEVEVSKLTLRLDFIDAPETKGEEKEAGIRTREWLQDYLSIGDTVQIDIKKQDMYDRFLSVIYKDGVNVNGELLKKNLVEIYNPANHNNGKQD